MRIAVYFAPAPDDRWWRFGARWLGRDPADGSEAIAAPEFAGPTTNALPAWDAAGWTAEARDRLAASPRRYGFHATLVAPFALAAGVRLMDVSQAAARFVAARAPVRDVPLLVDDGSGFVALRPARPMPGIDALAFDAVRHFDPLRMPLEPAERARRAAGLDAHGLALLDRWGYGRVADRFRFHLTLSDTLDSQERARVAGIARRVLADEGLEAIDIDGIALFVEGEDRVFRLLEHHRLGGDAASAGRGGAAPSGDR